MSCIEVSAADRGKSIVARVGDELVVSLPESPTTGYRWQIDAAGGLLVLEKDDFRLEGEMPGAGGVRLLSFRGTAPGRERLYFTLRREWEMDNPPLEDFSVFVEVN